VTAHAELHDGYVRIVDGDRREDFHVRWLRHFSRVDELIDVSELGAEPAIADVAVDDGVLRVTWAHDHRVSRFPIAWLHEHAYAIDRVVVPHPPSDVAQLELDGARGPDAVVDAILERLARVGAVLVRREHAKPESETEAWTAALEGRGLRVVGSQVGDIGATLGLHTEQPFSSEAPHYQLLHGIRAAEVLVADGEAAFRYLASLDAVAAELLVRAPVRFHRTPRIHDSATSIASIRDGRVEIRLPCATVAPARLSFERVAAWYRAHDQLVRILRDPRHHYRFTLRAGDLLVLDNRRMLHGRTAFEGPRWIRGVFFERPDAIAEAQDHAVSG
jgi:alpha-ketoglutarate-dependent taurine dioxygenase